MSVAQVFAKASDDVKTAKELESKFEANYVAEVRRRRDEARNLNERLRQQAVAASAGSKDLAAVHAELASHKAKAESLR